MQDGVKGRAVTSDDTHGAMKRCDVAIIGVGIVGASALYALTRAGVRAVALDAGVPGAGTSSRSFAWVNSVPQGA